MRHILNSNKKCGHYLPLVTLNLSKLLFPTIAADRWRFILHSRACADERMALHTRGEDLDKRDFFHYLLEAVDPETGAVGFGQGEMWGEANVLMIAGSDTTASALSASMYYLVQNPDKLRKLQHEIRNKFTSVAEIVTGKDLAECVYLKACIDEAMRLCPPVPGLLPREVVTATGMTVDMTKETGKKYFFPQGTVLGVNTYTLHHSPTHYPSPYTYTPERWLSPSEGGSAHSPDDLEKARAAYAPFSIGSRGCIGKTLAMMELKLVLARMAFEWEVEGVWGVRGKGECWEGGYR